MRTQTLPSYNNKDILQNIAAALFLGFSLFFLSILLFTGIFQLWFSGRIFPGVTVSGVDLGGLKIDLAESRLTQEFTYPSEGKILLVDQDRNFLFTPAEMGLVLDASASIQSALSYGRSGSLLSRLSQQMEGLYQGTSLPAVLFFDQRVAYEHLSAIAEQIDRPHLDASIGLEGLEVRVNPGEVGRTVDKDATLLLIDRQVRLLQDGVIPLSIRETPPTILDASHQAEVARAILREPLVLSMPADQTDGLGPWVIEPTNLAEMLTFQRVLRETEYTYEISVDPAALEIYLADVAAGVNILPKNARFIFNDDTRQIEVIEPSITGRTLDVTRTVEAVGQKLAAGEHSIPLEFAFTPPSVGDDATGESLGIRELIHAETSFFYGSSAARVQNIQAAAARFHGLLVPPNSTFSMAEALGDISLDNGYAEALIILNGRTISGVGGGVCQVSTTLFRTVFFSGYPIEERNAHAYRVSYYEKVAGNSIDENLSGLDATVFVPLVDFKFINDSPNWLLMETYVNPTYSSIIWKFYSASDERQVAWDTTGPVNIVPAPEPEYKENPELEKGEKKQVDWAADGADVTVNRTVTRDGEIYLKDTIKTHYLPWAAVFEYGPGTEDIPTPTPTP
ncbi:MAG: VanW family protein [Anaerolineaceae bacterium]